MIHRLSMDIPRSKTTLRLSREALIMARIACAQDEMSLAYYVDQLIKQDAKRRERKAE